MIAAPVLRKGRLIIGMHNLDSLIELAGLQQQISAFCYLTYGIWLSYKRLTVNQCQSW